MTCRFIVFKTHNATLTSSWLGDGVSMPISSIGFGTISLKGVLVSSSPCKQSREAPLRIYYQVFILIFAGRRSGLITLGKKFNLQTEFSSVIPKSIHLDFLTVIPFLLLLTSEKVSLIPPLLSTMARVAADVDCGYSFVHRREPRNKVAQDANLLHR